MIGAGVLADSHGRILRDLRVSITDRLKEVVWQKEARHHIGEAGFVSPPRSMSCIGG
jgi:hypothetical protein